MPLEPESTADDDEPASTTDEPEHEPAPVDEEPSPEPAAAVDEEGPAAPVEEEKTPVKYRIGFTANGKTRHAVIVGTCHAVCNGRREIVSWTGQHFTSSLEVRKQFINDSKFCSRCLDKLAKTP